jgi:hypothetical protein
MAYGVMVPVAIAATNVDAWNRSAISSASIFENGGLCALLTKSTTAGEAELWTATVPATADLMKDWIVYDPELVWTSSYRGLDPDVRNYTVAIGRTFSAFKPQVHDLMLMSEDCFTGAKGVNTFAAATNGQVQFVWGATQDASAVALKYIATQYISIATGAINDQRVVAYLMEVIPQT